DPCARVVESRPRTARPGHRRRGRGEPSHRGAGPQAVRRGGAGRRPRPAPSRQASRAQDRWRGGGPSDRLGLQQPTDRRSALDPAPPRQQARRAGVSRGGLSRDGPPRPEKNELAPWRKRQWVIPPEANAEFVYHMEDVLDVYTRPLDPKR